MMRILAIDPGPERSAAVEYESGRILFQHLLPNDDLVEDLIPNSDADVLVVEMIESYGMAVGREVFATCVWVGRFVQAWGGAFHLLPRSEVKLHLCGSRRAKDSNIRQALLDKLGPQGTKAAKGPTYGIRKDLWSALAVAVTYSETIGK